MFVRKKLKDKERKEGKKERRKEGKKKVCDRVHTNILLLQR
jgi:hypothetical protein